MSISTLKKNMNASSAQKIQKVIDRFDESK